MSTYDTYNSIISRKLATSSETYFDIEARYSALNSAIQEFTDSYRPKELHRKQLLTLRLDGLILHDCDTYNSSVYGAFVGSSDAVNVATDASDYVHGDGSVQFDIVPATSADDFAVLTVASLTSIDLSALEDTGRLRMSVKMPNVTDFTSITVRFGSSSTDYWEITVTTDINGNAFASNSWGRVEFDWANATENGTPLSSAVDYFQLRFNYTSGYDGGVDYRIDDIRMLGPGTPKIDSDYRIADIPSGLSTPNRVLRLENPNTKATYDGLDLELYHGSSGSIWTMDYNLSYETRKIFVNTSTETELLIHFVIDPTTLVQATPTGDSGVNAKADELIALLATKKLLTEAHHFDIAAYIDVEVKNVTRKWHGQYGLESKRLKSRFEREDYHNRH